MRMAVSVGELVRGKKGSRFGGREVGMDDRVLGDRGRWYFGKMTSTGMKLGAVRIVIVY